jgi:hypothetical protein
MKIELRKLVSVLAFLTIGFTGSWSQTECGSAGISEEGSVPPGAADPDFPPHPTELQAGSVPSGIVGLEDLLMGPSTAAQSFLLAGINVSQGAERESAEDPSIGSTFSPDAHVFGRIQLLKFHQRSETAVNYVGGGTFFNGRSTDDQLHRLVLGHRILWRRTQLTLGNSFGDLPGGTFGSPVFGGFIASQMGFPGDSGASDLFGSSEFGELSQVSHITNVSLAELTQALTPRSSVTLGGAYALTAYFGSTERLVNSRQLSARARYNYQLSRRDEIGVQYEFRRFRFPQSGAGEITTHLMQLVYGRQLSERMALGLGAGPELISLSNPLIRTTNQLSASGYVLVNYRLRKAHFELSYDHQATKGSGFFAGASSDTVRFGVGRPLWRVWEARVDAGYVRSRRLQSSLTGIPGNSFQYGFTGASVQRQLGRTVTAFARYEFSDENFDASSCSVSDTCGRAAVRHAFSIGLDWHIRPIRLE